MFGKKSKKLGGKVNEKATIVKQETIEVDGETKIKYTLSDGSEQIKGL